MAENNRRKEHGQPNKENMKSGRQSDEAPRTTETGAQIMAVKRKGLPINQRKRNTAETGSKS